MMDSHKRHNLDPKMPNARSWLRTELLVVTKDDFHSLREEGLYVFKKNCPQNHVKFSANKWKVLQNHTHVVNNATPLCSTAK